MDAAYTKQSDGSQSLSKQWSIPFPDVRDDDGEWNASSEYTAIRAVVYPDPLRTDLWAAKLQTRELDHDDPDLENKAEWQDHEAIATNQPYAKEARRLAYVAGQNMEQADRDDPSSEYFESGLNTSEEKWAARLAEVDAKFGPLLEIGQTTDDQDLTKSDGQRLGVFVDGEGYYRQAVLDEDGLPKEVSDVQMPHLFSFDHNKLETDQSEWPEVKREKANRDPDVIREKFEQASGNYVRYAIDNDRDSMSAVRDGLKAGVLSLDDDLVKNHFYGDAAQNVVGPFARSSWSSHNHGRPEEDYKGVMRNLKKELNSIEDREGLDCLGEKLRLTALLHEDSTKTTMRQSAETVYGIHREFERFGVSRPLKESESALIADRSDRVVAANVAASRKDSSLER